MSIFVDETTKVVYQALTGSQGRFYGLLNRDYGTQVVAGTSPKKAGTDVDGIPVFANVGDAVAATGANASCIFIPAPGVRDAVIEAADFIKASMSKPVSSYIAGVTAPPGKKMGHAGAIVSGGKGTAAAKMEALRDAGVEVGLNPTEAGELMAEIVSKL